MRSGKEDHGLDTSCDILALGIFMCQKESLSSVSVMAVVFVRLGRGALTFFMTNPPIECPTSIMRVYRYVSESFWQLIDSEIVTFLSLRRYGDVNMPPKSERPKSFMSRNVSLVSLKSALYPKE